MNSIKSLNRYSEDYQTVLLNTFGEWNYFKNYNKDIKFLDLFLAKKFNINNNITGFIKSRIYYIIIGIFSFKSLFSVIKKDRPDYIIIHLLTFIPLILLFLFNFQTKFILRISGYPKLNLFRKILWKLISKKIHKVFCPTKETMASLELNNIFSKDKFFLLEDPVIEISKIIKLRDQEIPNILLNKKYLLAIGRLSVQKNFELLLSFFKDETSKDPSLYLAIAGEGEQKKKIEKLIKNYNLENKVLLLGYQNNIHNLLKNCYCFILTSLWEDPGFVLVESAINNANIISSDCASGPKEIISYGKGGLLFKSNDINSLKVKFDIFKKLSKDELYTLKICSKKIASNYTKFRHFKKLNNFFNAN